MDNLENSRTVRYTLFSEKFGTLQIQEPKGWSNDVRSFERDKDSRGIVSKIDIDLEFYGNGAEYLKNVYTVLGIQEKVLLTKYEKNRYSLSEEWELRYIQEIDMGTYKRDEKTGKVTVNSTEGGLYSDIKNREGDDYDLLENTSADGVDIGNLTTHIFQPLGRKIFIESKLDGTANDFLIKGARFNSATNFLRRTVRAIPLNVVYNSSQDDIVSQIQGQQNNNNPFTNHDEQYDIGSTQNIGNTFFFQAERNVRIDLTLDLEYVLTKVQSQRGVGIDFSVEIFVSKLENSKNILYDKYILQNFDPEQNVNVTKKIENYKQTLDLNKGDSVGIVFTTYFGYYGNLLLKTGFLDTYLNVSKSELIVEDVTEYNTEVTQGKCIKPINLFDRIVAKITGKTGLVKSELFSTDYEYMVIDNGLWARGFPDVYKNGSDEDQKIQLVTSFKDAFESFNYIEPLTWFTEIIGSTEYVRIERATYTQDNFIGVSLGSVDKIQEEASKPDYFTKISLGHSKSMEYEEVNGLDESNGKSEFTTFITKNISEYSAISKYRTDAIAYELTRRYPFSLFPKEDTKRDNDIWIHDAKPLASGVITHKIWSERFDSLPKGIYDPESSWNLWLSPMNRLFYGHGYSIKRGLYHYPNKFIKFNSSNANQNLITEHQGLSLRESGSLRIKDVKNPKVQATLVNFTFKMTQEIEKLFDGYSIVNGENKKNIFGLIEYKENGINKYGRLVKLESSDEAKITLIKANV